MSEVLAAIDQVVQENACYTCSFQLEDVVLLHHLLQRRPSIPVLFLETGYHFGATCEYRDRLTRDWKLNLHNLIPTRTVAEQEAEFGQLYLTEPSRCCQLRKVDPLFDALQNYDAWFTGLRREQSP
ncbi:MAG: phosphoadenosine phosphosulfate reductase family protein, partial [Acidobacteriota bacterium]